MLVHVRNPVTVAGILVWVYFGRPTGGKTEAFTDGMNVCVVRNSGKIGARSAMRRVWNLGFAENMHVCGVGASRVADGGRMRGNALNCWDTKIVPECATPFRSLQDIL